MKENDLLSDEIWAILIPSIGLLGAAIAVVASELLVQFAVLGRIILRDTLQHPLRHVCFLAAVMTAVTLAGWPLGAVIRPAIPLEGAIVSSLNAGYGSRLSWRWPAPCRSKACASGWPRRSRTDFTAS